MSTLITGAKDAVKRIPWREYLSNMFYKALAVVCISLILLGSIFFSAMIDLTVTEPDNPVFIITMILSSTCYVLVIIVFIKIVLFDMAEEFGLRDGETRKLIIDARFFLFTILLISFCSAIYSLLDVFLTDTYLLLLFFVVFDWFLVKIDATIPGLTDKVGLEYYQTIRNIYFDFFFIVIIIFSIIIFLAIMTTLARMRIQSRFKHDEETYEAEAETSWFRKFLLWVFIPPFTIIFSLSQDQLLLNPAYSSFKGLFYIILMTFIIWWLYQLIKVIFKILKKGLDITAFLTSVNFLLLIPIVFIIYIAPVFLWTGYDVLIKLSENKITLEFSQILQEGIISLSNRWIDVQSIVYLDFVFITVIATFIIGFAEGFAILAIISAISRGVAVARTGQLAVRSPPKVMVISKYLLMLTVWLSLIWENFISIWQMLMLEFSITLPDIDFPKFFFIIYEGVNALVDWLAVYLPAIQDIPLLILPFFFILSASFKFFTVTLVTPRIKERLLTFFLLVSTAFVLIITQILGDIYDPTMNISDAPFITFAPILLYAVKVFTYIEALFFYAGFFFGIIWLLRNLFKSKKKADPDVIRGTQEKEDDIIDTG